jgi:glycosyltransferase involved in cell wall biosynthesis
VRVSFILPAHNEQRLIGRAITSVRDAASALHLEAEIIVSDDASDDRTAEIATDLGARVVSGRARQIAAARNLGARHATGDVLVFIDADSAVSTELVRQTLEAIAAGATGGGSRCAFDGRIPPWARALMTVAFPLYALAGLTPGAYIFATRAAFERAGGFDETLYGGEEVVLARALRRSGRFVIVPAAVLTSGRKLRTYSALTLLGTLARLGLRGRRGVADRTGMDIWYGRRPDDPGCPVAADDPERR